MVFPYIGNNNPNHFKAFDYREIAMGRDLLSGGSLKKASAKYMKVSWDYYSQYMKK